jgi:hypothetical protein
MRWWKNISVTTANYQQFGDNFRHPPRTGSITLQTINKIRSSPTAFESLEKYKTAAKSYRLNGVQLPFWRNWPLSADPSTFSNSEPPIHHWHKLFWDHDVKWCINVLGAAELDFRFETSYGTRTTGYSKLGWYDCFGCPEEIPRSLQCARSLLVLEYASMLRSHLGRSWQLMF